MTESPLQRLPGESDRAFETLIEYWKMGVDRSLPKLQKKLAAETSTKNASGKATTLGTIKTWSQKHFWVERCRQADAMKNQLVVDESIDDYLAAVNQLRTSSGQLGQQIFSECEEQLNLLIQKRRSTPDPQAGEILGMSRALLTIASCAEAAVAIQSRSLGLDRAIESFLKNNEHTNVSIPEV